MGHRHLCSTSQIFEAENDPSWNHAEQPCVHLGRASAAENSSNSYPVDNMPIDGANFSSHWNPASRSDGYSSSTHNVETQYHQLPVSGPSHDTFLYPSGAGSFSMVPENYTHHSSSSNHGNYAGRTFDGVEGGFFDLTMGGGRGPYKRKSPSVPAVCERGSTSRYYEAGSSSDLSISSDLWQEKPNTDLYQTPWDCHNMTPNYRGNGLLIGGDNTLRNVRSRAALDLETNLATTHLSSNSSSHSYTISWPADHPNSLDPLGQSSNSSTREWSGAFNSASAHDASIFSHEANHSIVGSSNPSFSLDIGGFQNNFISGRNPIPQNLQGPLTQSVRGIRSSNTQRSTPTFRASSSNLHPGHVAHSDEGLQLVAESYTSRHSRPAAGWRNSDRNGRTRISSERFMPFPDEIGFQDRLTTEGLMIVDRSALYGSRNSFDQHGDMRLDVDNMSYEELLALGERIGNVSTGLSEDLMLKCLTQSIYCSSDQVQDEGTCVICLEEYKNTDDVGTLKVCSHDFHVGCIKKWLSMKNLCPICKASALADHMKEK